MRFLRPVLGPGAGLDPGPGPGLDPGPEPGPEPGPYLTISQYISVFLSISVDTAV